MSKRKVLIVDDKPENLLAIVSIFEAYDDAYSVLQTIYPKKVLAIAQKEDPDIIITDWEMPELNGIELIKLLKSQQETKDIPIIIATGVMLTSSDLKTALNAGAFDYVRKPIDGTELIARCHSALTIKDYYNKILHQKNRELSETTLMLIQNKKFNVNLIEEINQITEFSNELNPKTLASMQSIKEQLEEKIHEDGWKKFQITFDEVYINFNKNLIEKFPLLTPGDIKLCQLIRMGLSTKDIATLRYLSVESVKVSRSRLRKKLNLTQNDSLKTFLISF